MRRNFALLVLVGLTFLTAPPSAFAHKVDVSCELIKDKLVVEGFYDDDTPAIKAKVEILDAQEKLVANGMTDEKGRWSCPRPAAGKYEIRLDAGAGHRAKRDFTVPAGSESSTIPPSDSEQVSGSLEAVRADATAIPWIKAIIGVTIIGGCSGAFLLASMLRKGTQGSMNDHPTVSG
jgi:hypothetical protein